MEKEYNCKKDKEQISRKKGRKSKEIVKKKKEGLKEKWIERKKWKRFK